MFCALCKEEASFFSILYPPSSPQTASSKGDEKKDKKNDKEEKEKKTFYELCGPCMFIVEMERDAPRRWNIGFKTNLEGGQLVTAFLMAIDLLLLDIRAEESRLLRDAKHNYLSPTGEYDAAIVYRCYLENTKRLRDLPQTIQKRFVVLAGKTHSIILDYAMVDEPNRFALFVVHLQQTWFSSSLPPSKKKELEEAVTDRDSGGSSSDSD